MNLPEWNADEWTAAATVGTLVVAVIALVFAGWQTRLARQGREDQARPAVHVELQLSEGLFQGVDLVVRNLGPTIATDVTLAFDPPLASTTDDDASSRRVSELAFLREGIPSLAPGGEVRTLLDLLPRRLEAGMADRYEVAVRCRDVRGRRQSELKYVLDIGLFYGLRGVRRRTVHDVAKSMHAIDQRMRLWTVRGRLGVWARDLDAQLRAEVDEMNLDALEQLNLGVHPRQAEIEALMTREAPAPATHLSSWLRDVFPSAFAALRRQR